MAAVVERSHDDAGIVWPVSVAPFEVVITVVNPKDVATSDAAEGLYDALRGAGIEVLLDDRDERPGVKFKDADLIGIPYPGDRGPQGARGGEGRDHAPADAPRAQRGSAQGRRKSRGVGARGEKLRPATLTSGKLRACPTPAFGRGKRADCG